MSDVAPSPNEKERVRGMTVSSSWSYYRFWSRTSWLLLLTYLPGVITLGALFGLLFPRGNYIFLAFGVWVVALWLVGLRTLAFRCPRCGQPFFRTSWYHNGFARECVHCGLPKWAEPGEGDSLRTES